MRQGAPPPALTRAISATTTAATLLLLLLLLLLLQRAKRAPATPSRLGRCPGPMSMEALWRHRPAAVVTALLQLLLPLPARRERSPAARPTRIETQQTIRLPSVSNNVCLPFSFQTASIIIYFSILLQICTRPSENEL